MGIRKELTPNVLANSRREYKQFEIAFNKANKEKRGYSHDVRKSSFPKIKRVPRKAKKERMVDIYTKSVPVLGFA